MIEAEDAARFFHDARQPFEEDDERVKFVPPNQKQTLAIENRREDVEVEEEGRTTPTIG